MYITKNKKKFFVECLIYALIVYAIVICSFIMWAVYGNQIEAAYVKEGVNVYYSGKPNQSNCGGDLFNIPLSNFIHENNLDNPWIYILDDDNIIHPRLISSFIKCANNNFYGNKEIITFINKWDCGHNREIDDYMITYKSDKEPRLEWFLFDPSQVIIKYSIIQK